MNHSRSNAPIRYCPNCGEVINKDAAKRPCSDAKHAEHRKERSHFCSDCGKKLR